MRMKVTLDLPERMLCLSVVAIFRTKDEMKVDNLLIDTERIKDGAVYKIQDASESSQGGKQG